MKKYTTYKWTQSDAVTLTNPDNTMVSIFNYFPTKLDLAILSIYNGIAVFVAIHSNLGFIYSSF